MPNKLKLLAKCNNCGEKFDMDKGHKCSGCEDCGFLELHEESWTDTGGNVWYNPKSLYCTELDRTIIFADSLNERNHRENIPIPRNCPQYDIYKRMLMI